MVDDSLAIDEFNHGRVTAFVCKGKMKRPLLVMNTHGNNPDLGKCLEGLIHGGASVQNILSKHAIF